MNSSAIENLEVSLTEQESLWDVYSAYRTFDRNKFNTIFTTIMILGLLALSLVVLFLNIPSKSTLSYSALNSLAGFLLNYAIGITGFLVAGVAILISVNDKNLFATMAKVKYRKNDDTFSKYSQFQFMFFNFLVALIFHLVLLGLSLALEFFTSEGKYMLSWTDNIVVISEKSAYVINTAWFLFITWLMIRCIFLVKSSIWNIYQMIVIVIVWSDGQTTTSPQ